MVINKVNDIIDIAKGVSIVRVKTMVTIKMSIMVVDKEESIEEGIINDYLIIT